MISGSEAVVLYLASGLEDHEQEFNHHRENTLSLPTALFLIVHPSFLRINCVTFLLGAVKELDRLHTYRAVSFSVASLQHGPSTTTFRLAYAPGSRSGYSGLGLL